jgi:8-oxo-dGTP diphosphatase
MRPLFHIAEPGDWPAAGEYRPASLESQGFVHLSFADQVEGSANRFYADARALDVIEVDPDLIRAPVVVEDTYGTGASFPHVYAPVPACAAVAVRPMHQVAGRWSFPVVRVSAVVLRDARGRVLSVRKRGTSSFMFPGGKPERGESAGDAAVRELAEELTISLGPDELRDLGVFAADAANEAGHVVEGTVFLAPDVDVTTIRPAAEITELRWDALDPDRRYPADLAALSAKVFDVLGSIP